MFTRQIGINLTKFYCHQSQRFGFKAPNDLADQSSLYRVGFA
jgi:hypothetical protein